MVIQVEVCLEDRWSIVGQAKRKADAIVIVDKHMASKKYDAARAVDTLSGNKVVYEVTAGSNENQISVGTIYHAPPCRSVQDTWNSAARLMGARLMRPHLDKNMLSVGEIWFTSFGFRRLQKEDRLMQLAVNTVAKKQAEQTSSNPDDRKAELYKFLELHGKAIAALPDLDPYVATLKQKGLNSMIQAVQAEHPKLAELVLRSVLATHIGQMPEPHRKLGVVLDIIDISPPAPEFCAYIDEYLAELLISGSTLKIAMGHMANRAEAIRTIAHTWRGILKTARDPMFERINAAIGRFKMPLTQSVLKDRLVDELNSSTELQKEKDREDKVFQDLLEGMTTSSGLIGDEAVAGAIVRRAQIAMKTSINDLTVPEAIEAVFPLLNTRGAKAKFLLDVAYSSLPDTRLPFVTEVLTNMANKIKDVSALVALGSNKDAVETDITAFITRVENAPMDKESRTHIAAQLQHSLAATLKHKFTKKTDTPTTGTGESGGSNAMSAAKPNQLHYMPGDYIFKEGDVGDAAYLINSGKIAILKSRANEEVTLGHLGRGDIFGEMALIDREPRMASARAVEETILSALPHAVFNKRLERLEEQDRIMRKIMDIFVNRLRDMAERTK